MWSKQGSKHPEVAHLPPLPPSLARQGGLRRLSIYSQSVIQEKYHKYRAGSSDDEEGHNVRAVHAAKENCWSEPRGEIIFSAQMAANNVGPTS